MSNLTDLYTAMKTRLGTVLSAHSWLPESLIIDDNSEQALRKGYTLLIGPGSQADKAICEYVTMNREIFVVITREHFALEQDRDAKYTVEQAILDDQLLVIKEFEGDPSVAYALTQNIANLRFISDGGIERVFEDKKNFYMIRSVFNVYYTEII